MADLKFDKEITGLLVIDPYNDFISEGGKVWNRLKGVAEANDCVPHMLQVLNAARKAGLRVFYALHRRYRPGDYETWKYIAPDPEGSLARVRSSNTARGVARSAANSSLNRAISWPLSIGVPAVSPTRTWICSSRRHGIQQLIVMGLIAHTCVEATVRLCRRAWLRGHGGERCDRELLG